MSRLSLFETLQINDQLVEVGLDDVKLWLPGSGKRAIGTKELNGCTCVVVLGLSAIILANISPLPGSAALWKEPGRDPCRGSRDHHERYFAEVALSIQQHANQFPNSSIAWGIFAVAPNPLETPDPIKSAFNQVRQCLDKLGFGMRPAFYKGIDPRAVYSPKGELVAFFKNGTPELWLEREKLWPETR